MSRGILKKTQRNFFKILLDNSAVAVLYLPCKRSKQRKALQAVAPQPFQEIGYVMYFAGDTVYKFFRVVFVLCGLAFAYQLVRCGLYDLDIDYVKGIIVYIIGAISYGIMWVAREFY